MAKITDVKKPETSSEEKDHQYLKEKVSNSDQKDKTYINDHWSIRNNETTVWQSNTAIH